MRDYADLDQVLTLDSNATKGRPGSTGGHSDSSEENNARQSPRVVVKEAVKNYRKKVAISTKEFEQMLELCDVGLVDRWRIYRGKYKLKLYE